MSRVFEALNKATHRDKHNDAVPGIDLSSATVAEPVRSGRESVDTTWDILSNCIDFVGPPVLSGADGIATTTWREKLEELFFGWDLRRYSSYPIAALEKESPAAEQYKILREQLRRLRHEAGLRTVAVTSAVKRDGKTTVAV